jgi:CBS domain-containing protein
VGIVTEHDVVRLANTILPESLGTAECGSAPVYTIEWRSKASEAVARMAEHRIRHVVVTDYGRLYGVVSYRDLAGIDVDSKPDLRVVDAMPPTRVVVKFLGDRSLRDAVREMVDHKIGCIPIVDEHDKPIRVVTRTDVVEAVMDALAEDDVLLDAE